MFVMFRFELKLSVTISIWVTCYMLHGASLTAWACASVTPQGYQVCDVSEPEPGRVQWNQAGN